MNEGQINQPISWEMPGDGIYFASDEYVIFYGTNVSLPRQQFNDTTENSTLSFVIGLPFPNDTITYYIWVAGKAGREEGPLSEALQLKYSGMYVCIFTALKSYCTILSLALYTVSCVHKAWTYSMPHHTEPSAPELTVQALSCQSVNVSWTPPKNDGGVPIIGYKIQYSKGSELALAVNSTIESVNITEIPPNTTIGITVVAENLIGLGEESKMMNETTLSRHNDTLVSITAVTASTVIINSNQEDGNIECVFRDAPARSENVQQLPQNISGLQPDTNYTLSCVAYDNSGLDLCIEHTVTVLTSELTFVSSCLTEVH